MADIIHARPGTNSLSGHAPVRYHDEGDGSYSESVAAHLRGWDATDGAWYKLPVDHATGALLVKASLAAGSVDIGLVDQGAPGATAWPVSLASVPSHPVTNAGTFAVQATLATETTKTIGVTRSADGSGNLLTSTGSALDVNLKTSSLSNQSVNIAQVAGGTAINSGVTGALAVGGDTGSAATDAGKPVKVGGVYTSGSGLGSQLLAGQRGDLQLDPYGNANARICGAVNASSAPSPVSAESINGDALPQSRILLETAAVQMLFNGGTSFDRARGNMNTTTGDTGAKATGAFLGATQTNFNARGAIITCVLGTVTGAVTTWQTGIQWSFDGGTTWLELTPLGANDTAAASGRTYTWIVYPTNTSQAAGTTPTNLVPGTISVAGPTQLNVVNAALPRTWRFAAQVSVVTSITITSVNVNYIL